MTPKQILASNLYPLVKDIKGFDDEEFFENIRTYRNEIAIFVKDDSVCLAYNLKSCVYVDWTIATNKTDLKAIGAFLVSFNKPIRFRYANREFASNHQEKINSYIQLIMKRRLKWVVVEQEYL